VLRSAEGITFAWTEAGTKPQVRVAVLSGAGLGLGVQEQRSE